MIGHQPSAAQYLQLLVDARRQSAAVEPTQAGTPAALFADFWKAADRAAMHLYLPPTDLDTVTKIQRHIDDVRATRTQLTPPSEFLHNLLFATTCVDANRVPAYIVITAVWNQTLRAYELQAGLLSLAHPGKLLPMPFILGITNFNEFKYRPQPGFPQEQLKDYQADIQLIATKFYWLYAGLQTGRIAFHDLHHLPAQAFGFVPAIVPPWQRVIEGQARQLPTDYGQGLPTNFIDDFQQIVRHIHVQAQWWTALKPNPQQMGASADAITSELASAWVNHPPKFVYWINDSTRTTLMEAVPEWLRRPENQDFLQKHPLIPPADSFYVVLPQSLPTRTGNIPIWCVLGCRFQQGKLTVQLLNISQPIHELDLAGNEFRQLNKREVVYHLPTPELPAVTRQLKVYGQAEQARLQQANPEEINRQASFATPAYMLVLAMAISRAMRASRPELATLATSPTGSEQHQLTSPTGAVRSTAAVTWLNLAPLAVAMASRPAVSIKARAAAAAAEVSAHSRRYRVVLRDKTGKPIKGENGQTQYEWVVREIAEHTRRGSAAVPAAERRIRSLRLRRGQQPSEG